MTDPKQIPMGSGIPPGAIHLGTFDFSGKGPGIYVGGVVKIHSKPDEDLLDAAISFLKAADRCLNGNKVESGIEMLTVPGTVCASFASELFLKYIVLRETGQQVQGHKLEDLFGLCSDSTRDDLSSRRPDILQVLQRNNCQFVGARYHHEKDQFSFRQQELLQLAELLSGFVYEKFESGASK